MPATTGPKFSCPSCGKQFAWKPELAGKKGKCKCGGVLSIPAKPPAPPAAAPEANPFDDPYSVAEEPMPAPPSYAPAPALAAAAPAPAFRTVPPVPIAAGADSTGAPGRQLHIVPSLKWLAIGAVVGALAVWEFSSPTDPDAPGRRRGLRAILVLANHIHPRGAFFVLAAFAAFMLVVGLMILFGKAKDDDYEQAQSQDKWPASRGRR